MFPSHALELPFCVFFLVIESILQEYTAVILSEDQAHLSADLSHCSIFFPHSASFDGLRMK